MSLPKLFSKSVLTSGQVAEALAVSSRTVCKWFDLGLLPGYRVPATNDRRFYLSDIVGFAEHYGMARSLFTRLKHVLILCGVSKDLSGFDWCGQLSGWCVEHVSNLFEAGCVAGNCQSGVIVADLSCCGGGGVVLESMKNKRSGWSWIVLLPEDSSDGSCYLESGCLATYPSVCWDVGVLVADLLRWELNSGSINFPSYNDNSSKNTRRRNSRRVITKNNNVVNNGKKEVVVTPY